MIVTLKTLNMNTIKCHRLLVVNKTFESAYNVFFSDLNECEESYCANGASCENSYGSYSCNCTETGYKGDNCDQGRCPVRIDATYYLRKML